MRRCLGQIHSRVSLDNEAFLVCNKGFHSEPLAFLRFVPSQLLDVLPFPNAVGLKLREINWVFTVDDKTMWFGQI